MNRISDSETMKTTFVQIYTFSDVHTDTVFLQSSLEKVRSLMITVESLRPHWCRHNGMIKCGI